MKGFRRFLIRETPEIREIYPGSGIYPGTPPGNPIREPGSIREPSREIAGNGVYRAGKTLERQLSLPGNRRERFATRSGTRPGAGKLPGKKRRALREPRTLSGSRLQASPGSASALRERRSRPPRGSLSGSRSGTHSGTRPQAGNAPGTARKPGKWPEISFALNNSVRPFRAISDLQNFVCGPHSDWTEPCIALTSM